MATISIAGNANAKRAFTVIGIRALAVLCLLGCLGALMTRWSEESELGYFIKEGTVSKARVLSSNQDNNTIVWNNGDRGQTSYNFVRVATDPAGGMPFRDFTAGGQEPSLPEPPTGEPTDELTRTLSVSEGSFAEIKQGDIVHVVTQPYDSSGAMLLSELTGRDYTRRYILAAIFALLAAGLWMVSRRFNRV